MQIIAFTGPAGAGKSHAAAILAERGFRRIRFAGPLKAMTAALYHEAGFTPAEAAARIEGALKETIDHAFERWFANQRGRDLQRLAARMTEALLFAAPKVEAVPSALDRALVEFMRHHWHNGTAALTPRHLMQTLGTQWGRAVDPDFWVRLWEVEAYAAGQPVVTEDCRFENEAEAVRRAGGRIVRIEPARAADLGAAASHESERGVAPDMMIVNEFTPDFAEAVARLVGIYGIIP